MLEKDIVMTQTTQTATPPTADVTIVRLIAAPRELVFAAWTDSKQLAQWWGPRQFTNPVCEVDARAGGAMLIHMRAPDGTVYPMTATFEEVTPPSLLVFRSVARDHENNPLLESLTRVTFEAEGGKTKVTVTAHAKGIAPIAAQMLAGMEAGWTQTVDRLEEHVV
jgi:uncharacterized protein YndB with AHSA1/START domain